MLFVCSSTTILHVIRLILPSSPHVPESVRSQVYRDFSVCGLRRRFPLTVAVRIRTLSYHMQCCNLLCFPIPHPFHKNLPPSCCWSCPNIIWHRLNTFAGSFCLVCHPNYNICFIHRSNPLSRYQSL